MHVTIVFDRKCLMERWSMHDTIVFDGKMEYACRIGV